MNTEGILTLADDMVQDMAMYDQGKWGAAGESLQTEENACGTVCCMAGFCYRRQVGFDTFRNMAASHTKNYTPYNFVYSYYALDAGIKQLGISSQPWASQNNYIFGTHLLWPDDLCEAYKKATTTKARVIVALRALQRMGENGEISTDPDTVYTHLPQLEQLLNSEQAV